MAGKGLQSTSRQMKVFMTLLFCLMTTAFMALEASASVDFVNQWPAKPVIVSDSAASPVTGIFKVGTGVNRLMIVAVATDYSAAQAPTFSVSYGGQLLHNGVTAGTNGNMILNNTTGNSKIWIGYLNEAGIVAAGSNKTLTVTPSITTNLTALYATAAVFNGVDQTTPITGSNSLGTIATALTIGPVAWTMTGNAGLAGNAGMSLYFTNWNNNVGQTTASTGYASMRNYVGTNMALTGSYKATTGASAESVTSTTTTTAALAALAGVGINPALRLASIATCGDCHSYPVEDGTARNVPAGMFPGTHEKHAGGDDLQYGYTCNSCHYNQVATNHSNGFKNLTGAKLPGNAYSLGKKIAVTNASGNGTCSNTACHSTGRTNIQYTQSPGWGLGTATNCLSCHAGRAGAGNNGAQATSTSGFKLSTTHSQHLKYPALNMNCNICHSKTADLVGGNLVLKQYTGVNYHANGTKDVLFTNLAYASYTSYKKSGADVGKCTNVSCHGGKSRGSWTSQGAINSDNTCVHCHGVAGTTTADTNRNKYAPGWGGTGISTDGNSASTDPRVGGHFKHLSSAYMTKKIKCNECHSVPSNPFDAGHFDSQRFASQTITFAQSSTANKNTTTPAYTNGSAGISAQCNTTYCHGSNMPKGDTGGSARSPLWNASLTGAPSVATCGACHGNPPLFGTSSSAHIGSAATTSCNGCHKTVVDATGNIINKALHLNGLVDKAVDTTLTAACNKCHGNPPQGGVVKYGRYSGLVKSPATLVLGASPANIGAHAKHAANGLTCNTCHNNFTVSHPDNKLQIFFRITSATITGWNATAQRAPYGTYSGNSGGIAIDASSTLIRTSASTNNSCNTYCHGGWTNSNRNMNPRWTSGAAATACGACHGASAAAPPQIGTHARHAGYSSALTARQGYSFACLKCHPSRTAGAHVKGAVHVRFSTATLGANATYTKTGATFSAPAGVRQYQTQGLAGDTADGTCSNISCHSNARSAGMGTTQYATTPAWGTTTRNCLNCHGGRASATSAPARSNSNFTLSTTHSQHLKYPAANINCQICHSKTATDAATLKNFTGVLHHANGVRDVTFTGITYGSYTSYKSTEAGSGSNAKTCTNTACHGGKSRSAWSATTTNNDNTCAHCHGTVGTSAALANTNGNRKFFAPGYNNTGTSTDQNKGSADPRVGAHFKHLSSIYMRAIKCNECHTVPDTPFTGTHMGTPRYNSQTLTFGQASSARILIGVAAGSTPSQLSAFAGYTSGIPGKPATCSSVYCHGNRLKTSDTSGKYRKPYWNYSAMVNYTDPLNACAQCHGNPPTTGTSATTHSGKAATVSCYACHPATVNASGQIIDKTKHINGQVEFYSHAWPYPGATHATPAGLTPWSGCTSCHTNNPVNAGVYPVARGTAPDCRGCHTLALSTAPSGISACSDCHGASVTNGTPNGAVFPNWSGNHTRHVVVQAIACTTCHGNSGGNIGDTRHGFSNHTAHSFALGFVGVTSLPANSFKWARVDNKTGSCSTNACHANATWGQKFACNSCHGYLATDTWTSTNYGGTAVNESAGAHVKHINYLITRNAVAGWSANDSYGSANFTAVCGTCHSINPTDHSMLKTVNTRNINFGGSTARQFGATIPTYNGVTGTSSSVNPKSCSNTDCHFRTSPVWSTY